MGSILPATTIISKKGDCVSIITNICAFEEHFNLSKYSFVILSRGDSPWKLDHLKQKLSSIWKLMNYKFTSLEFHILLYLEENKHRAWAMGALSLKSGILHI